MSDTLSSPLLARAARGQDVIHLQSLLGAAGCFAGDIDGVFGSDTEKALALHQAQHGLPVTSTFTPMEAALLGWQRTVPAPSRLPEVSVDAVMRIFGPAARPNLEINLPAVLNALAGAGLADAPMVAMALATVRVETSRFLPVSELPSKFNTSPGGPAFDLYDHRKELGNRGAPDGASFCGRGFIQLTGRANYAHFGVELGLGTTLIDNPFQAHESTTAARLLAAFLKNREVRIRKALAARNYSEARRLVNGGSNGLAEFTAALQMALDLLPAQLKVAA